MKTKIIIAVAIMLTSCGEVKQIGQLQIASTKSVETRISDPVISRPTYSKKQIRKRAEKTIDEAIDKELAKHPGALYMRNVRIYTVEKMFGIRYSVEGEIIGTQSIPVSN